MKVSLRLKRVIIGILAIVIIASNTIGLLVQNANASVDYSKYLGTQASLGSPLLNDESWDTDQWNKYELICFGIFLSNYVQPFTDSYKSAFDSTAKTGSKGNGLKALEFGSGNDSQAKQVLKALLEYAIPASTKTITPIKVKWKATSNWETVGAGISARDAKLRDLFMEMSTTRGGGAYQVKKPKEEMKSYIEDIKNDKYSGYVYVNIGGSMKFDKNGSVGDYRSVNSVIGAVTPVLYVEVDGQEEIILDYSDGYDLQMFTSVLGYTYNNKNTADNLIKVLENNLDNQIGLDCFGNIVCNLDGEYKVILPASCNQHLTKEKKYNLLSSAIVGDNYTSAKADELAKGLIGWKNEGFLKSLASMLSGENNTGNNFWDDEIVGGGPFADYGDSKSLGKVIMVHDSDSLLFKQVKKKKECTVNCLDGKDIDWGNELLKVANAKVGDASCKVPFKIEIVGSTREGAWELLKSIIGTNDKQAAMVASQAKASAYLSNVFQTDTNRECLNYCFSEATDSSGNNKTLLFNNAAFVATSTTDNEKCMNSRLYVNRLFNYISGNSDYSSNEVSNVPTRAEVIENLKDTSDFNTASGAMYTKDISKFDYNGYANPLFQYHMVTTYDFKDDYGAKDLANANVKLGDTCQMFKETNNSIPYEGSWFFSKGTSNAFKNSMKFSSTRIGKVYTKSQMFSVVSDTFSSIEGTEFAVSTPFIYLTYLDWYGITGEKGHEFNERLFKHTDINSLDAEQVFGNTVMSEEEKKAQVLNNTFLMLDPEKGREYRTEIAMSNLDDWVRRQYDRAVNGGSSSGTAESSISSSVNQGFLKLSTYADNFMTSFFVDWYTSYFSIIMGVMLILLIIVGLLGGKAFVWYLKSFIFMVVLLIMLPSAGEMVPYVCDNMVQSMFAKNTSHWAIMESIENSKIEANYEDTLKEDVTAGASTAELMMYLRRAEMTQLDRTIMIKSDISKKIVEDVAIDYEELQKLKTGRWLIPILMKQFSSGTGSEDYIYTSLGDLYINFTNMYWFYGRDANGKNTANHTNNKSTTDTYLADTWIEPDMISKDGKPTSDASTDVNSGVTLSKDYILLNVYKGYKDLSQSENKNKISYRSLTNQYPIEYNSHKTFYLLDSLFTCNDVADKTEKGFEKYAKQVKNEKGSSDAAKKFKEANNNLVIPRISSYNQYNKGVSQCFGYIWSTESPAHYFYQVVKDTFINPGVNGEGNIDKLNSIYANIEGNYEKDKDSEKEFRNSVMHWSVNDGGNGEIRDFLDLEELFTNMLPYMYTMQINACGTNLENGYLGDESLGDSYQVYKNNKKSWIYMCNWATKLVEYSMYSDTVKVSDSKGKEYKVNGCIFPQNYPSERPMVFSRAQMKAQGLKEYNLSYAELKMLNINDRVEKEWTMLLNYANNDGMTKEVLYRQMAITALTIFCDELSPDNMINEDRALYPKSLDLRNISFDNVMKLIMVSSTTNSFYMYSDTMTSVIADCNVITEIVLLLDAVLCASFIPFARNVLLGLLFYIMLAAVLVSTVKQQEKGNLKIWTAFGINNAVFALMTFAYYGSFKLMVGSSSLNNIIKTESLSVKVSVPSWKFFILLIASILYIIGGLMLGKFVFKHWKDMGFEAYLDKASVVGQSLQGAIGSVRNGINRLRGRDEVSSSNASGNVNTSGELSLKDNKDKPMKVEVVGGEVEIGNSKNKDLSNMQSDSGYYMALDSDEEQQSKVTSMDYNAEIKKGKEM